MVDREKLLRELIDLRAGEGITLAKLESCYELLEALGSENAAVARDELSTHIRLLGGGVKARSLLHAYGIDYKDPQTLSDRRAFFAAQIERSIDSVKDYEDDALKELLIQIEQSVEDVVDDIYVELVLYDTRVIEMTTTRTWRSGKKTIDEPVAPAFSNIFFHTPSQPILGSLSVKVVGGGELPQKVVWAKYENWHDCMTNSNADELEGLEVFPKQVGTLGTTTWYRLPAGTVQAVWWLSPDVPANGSLAP